MHMKNRIGFDIGGVILERPPLHVLFAIQRGRLSVNSIVDYAVPIRYVTQAIKGIAKKFDPANTFLISKASEPLAELTLSILRRKNFFGFTGIPVDNVHFCKTVDQKVSQCNVCDIAHFVDDNPLVLSRLNKVLPSAHLVLFQHGGQQKQSLKLPFASYSIVGDGRYLYSAVFH